MEYVFDELFWLYLGLVDAILVIAGYTLSWHLFHYVLELYSMGMSIMVAIVLHICSGFNSSCGVSMAVLVLILSLCLIIASVVSSTFMPIREF